VEPPNSDAASASRSSHAVLAAALSSLLVGLTVVGTREIVPRTDPLLIAFLRYFPAGLCFLPVLLGRANLITRRDWLSLTALGLMFYGVYPWLFSAAFKYTSALHGALVLPLLPLATLTFAAILRHETLTPLKFAGVAFAVAGIGSAFAENFLHATSAGPEAWKGDILMVAGILLGAIFNVLSRAYVMRYSALTVTAVTMLAGSIALALLVAVFAGDRLSILPGFSILDWLLVLFLSFGGPRLRIFYGFSRSGRSRPAALLYLQ
jgi:drug/metabolite transporter (DMT)-like permease